MMRYFGSGYPMMGFGGGLFAAIICALVIAFIVILIVRFAHHNSDRIQTASPERSAPPESDAMKILNERYAKGEIGDEEYKNKKANLR